jgi:hypothetical protein
MRAFLLDGSFGDFFGGSFGDSSGRGDNTLAAYSKGLFAPAVYD